MGEGIMDLIIDNLGRIGGVAGAVMTIIGLIVYIHHAVVKPISNFNSEVEKLTTMLNEMKTDNKKLNKATMRMTRDRITQAHTKFCGQGKIGTYELQSILGLHHSYKELGGNSFVDELIDDIKELDSKGVNK